MVREKITARWVKKASLGRKIGGGSLRFAPGPPYSRENYGQMGKKASLGRKIGGGSLGFAPGPPYSRENYVQMGEKSKFWP